MSADDPKSGTGPQDNVPQEQVQTNATWDTGGEKTPGQDQQDSHWNQVSDENADAGADTPVSGLGGQDDASAIGQQDRNPSTYGGMQGGLPASGATTHPDKTVDGEEGT